MFQIQKRSIIHLLTAIVLVLMLLASTVSVVIAKDKNSEPEMLEDMKLPPESTCTKYGIMEADNVCDPNSPNYDPSELYGPAGTRFGPPGERDESFYEDFEEYPPDGTCAFGTGLFQEKGVDRVWARQLFLPDDVWLDDPNDTLYAPTLMAPDRCKVESLAYYKRNVATAVQAWKVWEHTGPGQGSFVYTVYPSAAWLNRYTNFGGFVSTMIEKTGGEPLWSVYIYDWIDEEWDYLISKSGTSHIEYGWDAWEEYHLDEGSDWPDLPSIISYNLHARVGEDDLLVSEASELGWPIDTLVDVGCPYDRDFYVEFSAWYVAP
jgi:hypothetical protein